MVLRVSSSKAERRVIARAANWRSVANRYKFDEKLTGIQAEPAIAARA